MVEANEDRSMIARSLISTTSCASSRHPSHGRPPHPTPTSPPPPPGRALLDFSTTSPLTARRRAFRTKETAGGKKNRLIVAVPLHQCICPTARPARLSVPSGSFLLTGLHG